METKLKRRKSKREERLKRKLRKMEAEFNLVQSHGQQSLITSTSLDSNFECPTFDPTDEGYQEEDTSIESIKNSLCELRKKREDKKPRLRLCLTLSKLKGQHLQVSDLQSLLLHAVLGSGAPTKPRWCHVRPWRFVSQAMVIVIDVSNFNFTGAEDGSVFYNISDLISEHFTFISRYFKTRVLMDVAPCCSSGFVSQMLRVSLSRAEVIKEKLSARRKLLEEDSANCSVRGEACCPAKIKDFLLSPAEMLELKFPLPYLVDEDIQDPEFAYTKKLYGKICDKSQVFAVDCEMCITSADRHELTRISVVDWDLSVVFDTLVKPHLPIRNYLTKFSGITRRMLDGVTTRLADVQNKLREILPPDAILVGHSLNFDLHALRMFHPYVIDMSVVYNLSGSRQLKSGLKTLAYHFLNESIQGGSQGHCSVEDAWATMKLLQRKLQEGVEFGNVELGWNYKNFAEINGMDSNGKRKQDTPTDAPPSKRPRLEEATKGVGNKKRGKCESCKEPLRSACEVDGCFCQFMKHKHCMSCLFAKNCENQANNSSEELMDWKSALRVDCSDSDSFSGTEWIMESLARSKKQFLALTDKKNFSLLGEKKSWIDTEEMSNVERYKKFRERILDFDVGLIDFSLDGQSDRTQLECVDELVSKIVYSASKNSLISVAFLRGDVVEYPSSNSLCCIKIKE